jgi:hypothetical protein
MTTKPLVKTTKPKVPKSMTKSLARSGEFNILWAIVAVVGIALGLFLIFYVFHGAMPSLGASNALTVTAEEMGGVLTINIRAMGVSAVTVKAIDLAPNGASASSCSAYLDGNPVSGITSLPTQASSSGSSSGSSPTSLTSGLVTLNPGDTLSITCSSLSGSPTEVEVVTTSGAYTAPIS